MKRFFICLLLCLSSLRSSEAQTPQLSSLHPLDCSENEALDEQVIFPAKSQPRGLFLVVHGLNNNPESMTPLISELTQAGFHVLRVTLHGHGPLDSDKYLASKDSWLRNIQDAFCTARRDYPQLPLGILGYSSGAAAAVSFLNETDVTVDDLVFVAPAFSLTLKSLLVRPLRYLSHLRMPLLSLAPARYQRHRHPSPAMYASLFDVSDSIQHLNQVTSLRKTKGLLLLSRSDALIDYQGVRDWLEKNSLPWQVQEIKVNGKIFGHALLDEKGIGEEGWRQMKDALRNHFVATPTPTR